MKKGEIKNKNQKNIDRKKTQTKTDNISYRLKCAKTANGLSHFIMYGDVPKDQNIL